MARAMLEEQPKKWLRAIGAKLREDLGDCPTLPDEMRQLMDRLQGEYGASQASARNGPPSAAKRIRPRG